MDPLKPIGGIGEDDHGATVAYLSGLVQESAEGVDPWLSVVQDNLNLFVHGDASGPVNSGKLILHEIQNNVIAITDIQTKEPPSATLEPVETGEPPLYFWAGPAQVGMLQFGLQPFEVDDFDDGSGQLHPPMPLDEEMGEYLQAMAVPKAQAALMPGAVRDDWIVAVDDRLVADVYQTVLDVLWQRSGTDRWIRENVLYTNVQGWTWGLYEWDAQRVRHVLRHIPVGHVHVDPTVTDIADSAFVGIDYPIDADEAKAHYPDLADVIDREAKEGYPQRPDGMMTLSSQFDRNYRRKMITLRVFWLRNQLCPMTVDEALQSGHVQQTEVPDDSGSVLGGAGEGIAVGDGAGASGATPDAEAVPMGDREFPVNPERNDFTQGDEREVGDAGQGAIAAGGEPGNAADDEFAEAGAQDAGGLASDGSAALPSGQSAGAIPGTSGPPIVAPPPTRTALVHRDTGAELTPTVPDPLDSTREVPHPDWPHRLCTRQLTVIANKVVDDRESPNVPIVHNVNIPIPRTPFGQGEPQREKDLQAAMSDTMHAMVEHQRYNAHPAAVISRSMADEMEGRYGDCYVKPGRTMIVDDDVLRNNGGKLDNIFVPPALSPAAMELFPILLQMMQRTSGNTDEIQGRSSSQVHSGRAIAMLQSAATSVIGFKGARTGDMVRQTVDLMLYAAVHYMTPDQVYKIVSKYPRHVLDAIVERAKAIEWNVIINIEAGTGQLKQAKAQNALMQFQAGLVDRQTAQEDSGLDPRVIEQRMMEQAMKMQRAGMMNPQAAPAEEQQQPAA